MADDNNLAYGEYQNDSRGNEGAERGLVSDSFQKLQQNEGVASLFNKVSGAVQDIRSGFDRLVVGASNDSSHQVSGQHRFDSFAGPQDGNDVKWYVDGCGYFWAVSMALQEARQSIWILDCKSPFRKIRKFWVHAEYYSGWLSPELYLRRPPAANEQYRLDRMLQSAAQRGVQINIIIYKEVKQALTRQYSSHFFPIPSLPHTTPWAMLWFTWANHESGISRSLFG